MSKFLIWLREEHKTNLNTKQWNDIYSDFEEKLVK